MVEVGGKELDMYREGVVQPTSLSVPMVYTHVHTSRVKLMFFTTSSTRFLMSYKSSSQSTNVFMGMALGPHLPHAVAT